MPHIHEKIDYTAEVFIVYKNKVLMRFHDKYNIWGSVGGHVELDEDPNEAAVREVKEEVGLDIKLADDLRVFEYTTEKRSELIPPKFMCRVRMSPTHEHITMTYFATSETDQVNVGSHEAKTEWKWVTAEELEVMDLIPDMKFYAKQALKELGVE